MPLSLSPGRRTISVGAPLLAIAFAGSIIGMVRTTQVAAATPNPGTIRQYLATYQIRVASRKLSFDAVLRHLGVRVEVCSTPPLEEVFAASIREGTRAIPWDVALAHGQKNAYAGALLAQGYSLPDNTMPVLHWRNQVRLTWSGDTKQPKVEEEFAVRMVDVIVGYKHGLPVFGKGLGFNLLPGPGSPEGHGPPAG
ncbi:MAG TPA: hypothetical protein VKX16_17370 [Chloroflexota bacterium]|nr:hypothetical protein [Chloroflexota bacterium]